MTSRSAFLLSLLVCVFLLLIPLASASAQTPSVGLFADPTATENTLVMNAFVPFNAYAVATLPTGGLRAFDLGIDVPPGLVVLDTQFLGGGINIAPPDTDDWLVGIAQCVEDTTPVLVQLTMGWFSSSVIPLDTAICLRASNLGDPQGPSYEDCASNLQALPLAPSVAAEFPDGCLVLNPSGQIYAYERFVDIPPEYTPPNTTASMYVGIDETLVPLAKDVIVGPTFAGVEIGLGWYPGVATWAGAELAPYMDGWTLEVVPISDGEVTLRAISPDPSTLFHSFFGGETVFVAHLEVTEGTTPVTTTHQKLITDTQQDWPLMGTTSFLTTDPVIPVESTSFSALKSRY